MSDIKEPEFVDGNQLCLAQMNSTKRQILDGIDFRLKRLKTAEDRFRDEKIEELELVRSFVKSIMYKKDSYKELL